MEDLDLSDDSTIQQVEKRFEWLLKTYHGQPQLSVELNYALGITAYQLKRYQEAIEFLKKATQTGAEQLKAHLALTQIYQDLELWPEAESILDTIIALAPHLEQAYFQGALVRLKQGKPGAAAHILKQVHQKTTPSEGQLSYSLLEYIKDQLLSIFSQDTLLMIQFLEALIQVPLFQVWILYLELGYLYHRLSLMEKAISSYQQAFQLSQNLWILLTAMLSVPRIYQSREEILSWRQIVLDKLSTFSATLTPERIKSLQTSNRIIFTPNFYYAYQGLNDKELNMKLMQLYNQILRVPFVPLPTSNSPKIRVGFLSSFFRDHSVSHSFYAFIKAVSEDEQFEIFGLSHRLNGEDLWTEKFRTICSDFIVLPEPLEPAAQEIHKLALDILVFTDIGMNMATDLLALFRMAPVQCVLGGHPVTTGSPEMDYYISTDILEGPHAQEHYSETLYLTKGSPIATYNETHKVLIKTPKTRQELGLPEGRLYYCPMSLFKIHPDFDIVVQTILKQDLQARILFAKLPDIDLKLKQRLREKLGTEMNRVHFHGWLSKETFYQVLSNVDVVLDSFPFGGGNTTCISLLLGQPIVTLTGEFLRGRVATAYYTMMGLEHLANTSVEAYIQMALKIGQDLSYRQELQTLIRAHNHLLLNNYQGIEQLIAQFKTWGQGHSDERA